MDKNKDVVSIVFGDSIVYGLHDNIMCGWVNRIRVFFENNLNNHFIINLGIPGENSLKVLRRFENEFIPRYNDLDIFNIIFSFGIKDSLILNENDNYILQFEKNVIELIDKAKKYSKNIYFIGLIETDKIKRKEYNKENIILIDESLKNICKKNGVEYIKLRNVIKKEDLQDGLHPNSVGHQKISEILLKRILNNKEINQWIKKRN